MKRSNTGGFTLIEIAIVLLIIGLLTGGLLMPLAMQYEIKQRQQVQKELKQIRDALLGYYLIHGHFPCPASHTSGGLEHERTAANICKTGYEEPNTPHGFVPYAELGLTGSINAASNLMEDVWGHPYRYSVSNQGATCLGKWVYTTPYAFPTLRENIAQGLTDCVGKTIENHLPNLQICDAQGHCAAAAAAVVIFSLGKNAANTPETGTAEARNRGTISTVNSNILIKSQSNTKFYIGDDISTYDDLVEWISPNVLFNALARTNQL
jgi:prepilin-type N-terminal cleavage/methylation domain-containing protein